VSESLLEVHDLEVDYKTKGGRIKIIRGVDLQIGPGEIVGLVGETGSGKTTIGKAIMRLLEPTAGRIVFAGEDITHLSRRKLRSVRRQLQMVFQDPYSSLNPRMTVSQTVEHPLAIHKEGNRKERVNQIIERVGLSLEILDRYPGQLSGGQRQRVALARALVLSPSLLVADEPVSALDVSVQAGILNLLLELQRDLGFSCLFITHDLSVAEHLCDRVAVMYLGQVVEVGSRREVFLFSGHPYTRSLLEAVPIPDPAIQKRRTRHLLGGEPPSPLDPPSGCSLHPRCWLADDVCRTQLPALVPKRGGDHMIRCHHVLEAPTPSLEENRS